MVDMSTGVFPGSELRFADLAASISALGINPTFGQLIQVLLKRGGAGAGSAAGQPSGPGIPGFGLGFGDGLPADPKAVGFGSGFGRVPSGIGLGQREPGERGEFAGRGRPFGIPGAERIDLGFPRNALTGLVLAGPIGAGIGLARDFATAPRTRSLTDRQARSIQERAIREDREANRALREGRGSGAGPRRGAENAGNRGR